MPAEGDIVDQIQGAVAELRPHTANGRTGLPACTGQKPPEPPDFPEQTALLDAAGQLWLPC